MSTDRTWEWSESTGWLITDNATPRPPEIDVSRIRWATDTETPKPPDDTPAEPADDPVPETEPTEDPEVEPKP